MTHFLELAKRGKSRSATEDEKRACKLAWAVVDFAPGLDTEAIYGLRQFILAAAARPETAREVLGS